MPDIWAIYHAVMLSGLLHTGKTVLVNHGFDASQIDAVPEGLTPPYFILTCVGT